ILVARAAAEHCLHARDELARLERLGDVIIRAELEADDAVRNVAPGGQHDDWQAAGFADLAAHGEAVHVGQHDVKDDPVRRRRLQGAKAGLGMRHRLHGEAEPAEVLREQLVQALVVVNDENSRAHSLRSACIGGIRAARRAGSAPNPRPMLVAMISETRSASHGTPIVHLVANATAAAPATPTRMPPVQPPTDSRVASERNWRRMSRGCAPTAIRRPISPVRSLTDSSMSARIPVPPRTTATAPTAAVRRESDSMVSCCSARKLAAFWTSKSGRSSGSTRWRARRISPISRSASAMRRESDTLTKIVFSHVALNNRRRAVRMGTTI